MTEAAKFEIGETVEVYLYGNGKPYKNPCRILIDKRFREFGTWVYEDAEGNGGFEYDLRRVEK